MKPPTPSEVASMTPEQVNAYMAGLKAALAPAAPAPAKAKASKAKGRKPWGRRTAQSAPREPQPPKDPNAPRGPRPKPRAATPSEWMDLTGDLLEAREVVRLPAPSGVGDVVLTYKRFAKLAPYIAQHWEKPDPETGELKKTRGKTVACRLADVAIMAEAWRLASAEVGMLPLASPLEILPDDEP